MENNYKHNHFRIYKDIYFYIQKPMLFNDTMLRLYKRGHSPGPLLPQAFSCRVPGRLPHPGLVSLHLVLGYTSSPQHPLIKYADTSKAWTSSSQVWPPWLEPEAWLGGGGGCGQTGCASGYNALHQVGWYHRWTGQRKQALGQGTVLLISSELWEIWEFTVQTSLSGSLWRYSCQGRRIEHILKRHF